MNFGICQFAILALNQNRNLESAPPNRKNFQINLFYDNENIYAFIFPKWQKELSSLHLLIFEGIWVKLAKRGVKVF